MAGRPVEKTSCPNCGSSDANAIYEQDDGRYDAHCFSCGAYDPNPEGWNDGSERPMSAPKTTEAEKQQAVCDVYSNYPVTAITDRGISLPTAQYFDVRVGLSTDGSQQVVNHFYPLYNNGVLQAYKVRQCADKMFWHKGTAQGTEMFGQYQASFTGAKKLIITEGELDAMSVYQALRESARGTEYEQYQPAVVSITKGAKKGKGVHSVTEEVGAQQAFLSKFQEFIICFDQDAPGQESAEALAKYFPPGTAHIVRLPMKDANEMLMAGKIAELKKAVLFNASQYKPAGIIRVSDVIEQAKKPVEWGIPWPWPTLHRLTKGIRRGELVGVGAGVGCGKTTFWHELVKHLTLNQGLKVGTFMLEERPYKTVRKLVGSFMGVDISKPEAEYDKAQADALMERLEPYICMFDHKEDRSWEIVKEHIRHLVLVEGCKDIILDPISALTYQYDSSQANTVLNQVFGEASAMADALDFTLYYSSHLNPPDTGKPHEEGGRVKAAQFTGSRAMIKWSHYVIGLERDTQAETLDERNTVTCRILKDREHGETGHFPIKYHPGTGQFLEPAAYEAQGVQY